MRHSLYFFHYKIVNFWPRSAFRLPRSTALTLESEGANPDCWYYIFFPVQEGENPVIAQLVWHDLSNFRQTFSGHRFVRRNHNVIQFLYNEHTMKQYNFDVMTKIVLLPIPRALIVFFSL